MAKMGKNSILKMYSGAILVFLTMRLAVCIRGAIQQLPVMVRKDAKLTAIEIERFHESFKQGLRI